MKLHPLLTLLAFTLVAGRISILAAVQPDVAEITFGKPGALAEPPLPAWIAKVEHQGGQLLDAPRCWQVGADALAGAGRVSVAIDRSKMKEDLVATILFDSEDTADLAVQLFDGQGRVVVVDLFGNLVDVSKEATTNTFVVPLRKYPTAEQIVVRRVKGEVKVYGIVLYPIVTEGEPNDSALRKLAAVLGDPLSTDNPLLTSLQKIATSGKLAMDSSFAATAQAPAAAVVPIKRSTYPGAVLPPVSAQPAPAPTAGLVAWWSFDQDDATDFSGRNHHGVLRGGFELTDGIHGKALRLHRGLHGAVLVPPARDLELKDSLTVSAWIKFSGNAGSQIVWFGDRQKGRDPWLLSLLGDKRLRLRSDRSVTDKPAFEFSENEIKLLPDGRKEWNQHVAVDSPGVLAPNTWYFVACTVEKVSPQVRALRLYVNGEAAGEERTQETIFYSTAGMHVVLGAVNDGDWQNFDGLLDEVRIYDRPLAPAEIKTLYLQPRL